MAGNNGSNDADQKKTTSQFASLLQQWQSSDDGSTPFEVAKPKVKSKTSIKTGNEKSIKDYKQELQAKNFKAKTPTRGMSQWTKPAQLQNLFEKKIEDKSYETDYKPPVFKKTKEDTELIRTTIQQNFFFNDMKLGELPAFIEAFEPIEVEKGSSVITQGDLGDFFYIVGKGSVVFQINGDKIGTAEVGGAFGELALLYSCRRAATVTVESSPTTLFRVGRKTFRSLMQKQTKQKECEKIERLKAVDFLKEISDSDRKRLGRSMTLQVFGPGEYLVKKGDEGDTFYIVHEGQVEVTDISVGSAKFGNIVLEPGAYFGERALATKEPRAANVIAKTNGSAFRINRKKFEKVVGKLSRIIMRSQDRKILVRS
jgi:cAMP-dependent protein kinase regulator